jgi:hypothetical protein
VLTCNVAVRTPVTDGENVTTTLHVLCAESAAPQVDVRLKSAEFGPSRTTLKIVKVESPVLEITTVCGRLATARGWTGKFIVLTLSTAFPVFTPVPFNGTLCGELANASVNTIAADWLAAEAGPKDTATVQLPPTETVPQVFAVI